MTVEELIRELQNHDPQSEALLAFNGELLHVESVEWGKVHYSEFDQAFDRLGVIVFSSQ